MNEKLVFKKSFFIFLIGFIVFSKQLKKAGTAGQESTVFGTYQKAEQVEPINTLLLNQEAVKRKNQRARGHSTLLLSII